jgi:glycosyltransferase involved in cell wall biosynthesis
VTGSSAQISVVLPTYNRLAALRENFGSLLALAGVSEIVVVDDGSTDGTWEWLGGLEDPRVRSHHQAQRGSPAARNAGVAAARGEWILMTEDDCWLPPEFAITLLDVANAHDAQIVSAPWLRVGDREQMADALERGRREARPRIGLSTHPSVFPSHDLQTPFLNGIVLARRDVLRSIGYDESLRGNAWREETSMFLGATERGLRCVLTPRTASFQFGQWDGGQRRPRLSYEAWAVRNNWRFLRMHAASLRQMGEIRSVAGAQARFVAERLRAIVRGYTGARRADALARIRRRGIRSDLPGSGR